MRIVTETVAAPAAEPVSLKDIKEHLAIPDLTSDDALLCDLTAQCRSDAEHWTGRIYADREMRTMAQLGREHGIICIPLSGPVIRVHHVKVSDGRDEVSIPYKLYGDMLYAEVDDGTVIVTVSYFAGSSEYLEPSVDGAIKEMVRIAYRRDGTDTMSPAVKRMLRRPENL